jgi:hypothetical protein
MYVPAPPPRHLGVCRPLGVVLEEFLQPLAASLGHDARVPPSAGGAGGGLDDRDGIRVLGAWLGARTDLFAAVTDWFLTLHELALPSTRALVMLCSMSIAENQAWARRRGNALQEAEGRSVMSWVEARGVFAKAIGHITPGCRIDLYALQADANRDRSAFHHAARTVGAAEWSWWHTPHCRVGGPPWRRHGSTR